MASIRKHYGKHQVRYVDPSGKQRAQSFDAKADAKAFAAKVEVDKLQGQFVDPRKAKTPFGDWAAICLASRLDIRPATRNREESLLKTHVLPSFGTTHLANIKRANVQAWVKELSDSHSPSTVRGCFRILSSYLTDAVDERLIAANPCVRVTLPRQSTSERRYLTTGEVQTLISEAPSTHRPLLLTAVLMGCRWSELVGLKREHLDLLRKQMKIVGTIERVAGSYRYVEETKTGGSRRTLKLPNILVEVLAQHLAHAPESEYVFPAHEGGFLRYDNFRTRVWNPTVERADLAPLRFHELRHTCAAILIDMGANPLEVSRRLGHNSIKTTLGTYGHLFPNREDDLNDALERAFPNVQMDEGWTKQPPAVKLRAISAGQEAKPA